MTEAALWVEPAAEDRQRHPPQAVFEAGERHHHVSNTAYPIAHGRTWAPYRVARAEHAAVTRAAFQGVADLCLYLHVPFCESRCAFCEYAVVPPGELGGAGQYVEALLAELAAYDALLGLGGRTVHGLDLGGGTPSLLDGPQVEALLERIRGTVRLAPGAEISIETTPRVAAAHPERLRAYAQAGIGRISMGVQVTQGRLLEALGRGAQGSALHRRAAEQIRAAGFRRFNVDLMYGFADQSLADWEQTLRRALALEPEFITLYRMRYKLTRICAQAERVRLEDVQAQAQLAKELLHAGGFAARPGKNTFSRLPQDPGTSSYLTRRVVEGMPYLGLGLGAQSFGKDTIAYNAGAAGKALAPYLAALGGSRLPIQDLYRLPLAQAAAKMVAVSFYFGEVNRAAFAARFGRAFEVHYAEEVRYLKERGLMVESEACFSLTPEGARRFHGAIALFFAPSVQALLLERAPRGALGPSPAGRPARGLEAGA